MKFKIEIKFKEYLQLNYKLFFRRKSIIILYCIGIFILINLLFNYLGLIPKEGNVNYSLTFILTILFLLFPLIKIYVQSNRNYKSYLCDNIEVELLNDKIKFTRRNIYVEMDWSAIQKYEELKKWFIFYDKSKILLILSKINFSESEITEIRKLILELNLLRLPTSSSIKN